LIRIKGIEKKRKKERKFYRHDIPELWGVGGGGGSIVSMTIMRVEADFALFSFC
jgi:hypothetical protein